MFLRWKWQFLVGCFTCLFVFLDMAESKMEAGLNRRTHNTNKLLNLRNLIFSDNNQSYHRKRLFVIEFKKRWPNIVFVPDFMWVRVSDSCLFMGKMIHWWVTGYPVVAGIFGLQQPGFFFTSQVNLLLVDSFFLFLSSSNLKHSMSHFSPFSCPPMKMGPVNWSPYAFPHTILDFNDIK